MEVGEHWAYRARRVDPLVEIEIRRIGTQKPARVLASFVDVEAEGREDWLPPAHLKVLWSDVSEFEAREARWDAVFTHPELRGTAEEEAVDHVRRIVITPALAKWVYQYPGVTKIVDVNGLAERLQLDEAVLRAEPVAFEEDGALFVPWATTALIVHRACELFPDLLLRDVEEEEAEARQAAMHGRWEHVGRGRELYFTEPEVAAKWDAEEPYGRPKRELLRRWCGEAVERFDELVALRAEVVRVDTLLSEAIGTLRESGLRDQAVSLERRFGVPLSEARSSRR